MRTQNVANMCSLQNLLLVGMFSMALLPYPMVDAYASERVTITPPGFRLETVVQDIATQQIVATFVVSGGAHVIPVLYMPRVNSPDELLDTNANPCAVAEKNELCCLRSMVGMYDLDVEWEHKVNSSDCVNSTQMPVEYRDDGVFAGESFGDSLNGSTVLQGGSVVPIPGVVYKYERIGDENVITLRMATTYVEPRSKLTELSPGTFKYEFFVGIVFATMLDATAGILSTVVQTKVEFTKSDYGFIAVGTTQDRSKIKQVETFVQQGRTSPDHRGITGQRIGSEPTQFIEVNVAHDPSMVQDGRTVSVVLDTIKLIKASVYDESADWLSPCTGVSSGTATGYYDDDQADVWDNVLDRECLPTEPVFCDTAPMTTSVFWIPLYVANATRTGFITTDDSGKSLFFNFDVAFTDPVTGTFVEHVWGTVDLSSFPVLTYCDDTTVVYTDVTDTVKVDIKVGTNNAPTGRRLLQSDGVETTQTGGNSIVNKLTATASSYQAAAISMTLDGLAFSEDFSTKFQLDNLVVFNFLGADNVGYDNLLAQISNGTGVTIEKLETNGVLDGHFTLTPAFTDLGVSCEEVGSGNTNINCLWRRTIIASEVQTGSSAKSVYMLDPSADTNWQANSIAWAQSAYEISEDEATTFVLDKCPGAYTPRGSSANNMGAYSCVFVDPGYRWVGEGGRTDITNPFMISDKTVVLAVISIDALDYENIDEFGNALPTTRRLLSMGPDGSSMVPLSTIGGGGNTLHTPFSQMSTQLKIKYANRLLDRPQVFTKTQMQHRLRASWKRWYRPASTTKLAVLGNHALTRRLLQYEPSMEEKVAAFQNKSMADVFEIANDFVCAPCNIAYLSACHESQWQMFKADVEKPKDMSMAKFQERIDSYLRLAGRHMGSDIDHGRSTGFTHVGDVAAAAGSSRRRALLQVTAHDGLSTTVNVAGIFKMSTKFGELYSHMFKCILSAAATHTNDLEVTVTEVETAVAACTTTAPLSVTAVKNALLTDCGNGTVLLDKETCNKLYEALILGVPSVAFDWYNAVASSGPAMYFQVRSSHIVEPGTLSYTIYSMRENMASALGVHMDRVMIEIRDSDALSLATDEQLATTETVVLVWVYTDAGNAGRHLWPAANAGPIKATYTSTYKASLKAALKPLLGVVVLSPEAEIAPFTALPFQPALMQFSLVVAVDVKLKDKSMWYSVSDVNTMMLAVKEELAVELKISQLDIRALSIQDLPAGTTPRFSMEMRFTTRAAMEAAQEKLIGARDAMALEISTNIKARLPNAKIQSVKVVDDSVKLVINTQTQDNGPALGLAAILAIIGGCVVFVAIIAFFCYTRQGRGEQIPDTTESFVQPMQQGMQSSIMPMQMFTGQDYSPMYDMRMR